MLLITSSRLSISAGGVEGVSGNTGIVRFAVGAFGVGLSAAIGVALAVAAESVSWGKANDAKKNETKNREAMILSINLLLVEKGWKNKDVD